MQSNILVVNECFSDNLGDQAIALSIKEILATQQVFLVDFSGKDISRESRHVQKENKINIRKKFAKIRSIRYIYWILKNFKRLKNNFSNQSYKICIIGGGQLILSNNKFPIALFTWSIFLLFYKVPYIIYGVGCGRDFSILERKLIQFSLKHSKEIFIRDEVSKKNLEKLTSQVIKVCPDVVYGHKVMPSVHKSSKLIVGVASYDVFKRYRNESALNITSEKDYVSWLSNEILNLGYTEMIFCCTTKEDLDCSAKVYQDIRNHEKLRIIHINTVLDLNEYEKILSSSEAVSSGRMHALILGELAGCKIYPQIISEKLETYSMSIGSETVEKKSKEVSELLLMSVFQR